MAGGGGKVRRLDLPESFRVVVVVVWWAWLAGACSAAEAPGVAAELGVGEPLPAIGLSGERPALVWVFAAEQCLGCELGDPAWVVRGLQRRFGKRIETVVVAVGEGREGEEGLVTGFLASQRISARVETRTLEEYTRDFGSAPLSVLYVVNRKAVIEVMVAADAVETWRSADGRRELAGFVEEIVDIVSEGPVPAEEGSGIQQ